MTRMGEWTRIAALHHRLATVHPPLTVALSNYLTKPAKLGE
jgi:hypothetical protein